MNKKEVVAMAVQDTRKDFLVSTEGIVNAGTRLSKALREKRGRDSAVGALERAVEAYDRDGSGYQAFKFSQLNSALDKASRERLSEDVLAAVLLELQVANVLTAAGSAIGEGTDKAPVEELDSALKELGSTKRTIERSLSSTVAGRFGFQDLTAVEPLRSPGLPSAASTFEGKADEVLKTLVDRAEAVVGSGFKAISKLDPSQALSGLSRLGESVQPLPRVGKLLRYAATKLNRAADLLINLFGTEAFTQIREKLKELWQSADEKGEYISRALGLFFGVEATRRMVTAASLQSKDLELLDRASIDFAELGLKFKERMEIASSLVTAVTCGSALLAFTPLAGPALVLFTGSLYFLIIAGVVLMGMDFADSSEILCRVRGVREITASVLPAS
jgi:hypothetical protein